VRLQCSSLGLLAAASTFAEFVAGCGALFSRFALLVALGHHLFLTYCPLFAAVGFSSHFFLSLLTLNCSAFSLSSCPLFAAVGALLCSNSFTLTPTTHPHPHHPHHSPPPLPPPPLTPTPTTHHSQEEVIVGRVEGATIPEWHVSGKAVWPTGHWDMFKTKAGQPFPKHLMENAAAELDNFSKILEQEGVIVRRPEILPGDYATPYETPGMYVGSVAYLASVLPRFTLSSCCC
jgi:hypothetical protein